MKNSGQCNYCGKTYTKSGILKHIKSCKERQAILHKNDNGLVKNYFHLKIVQNIIQVIGYIFIFERRQA